MKIVYIAHPIGPVNPIDSNDAKKQIANNLESVKQIVRYINMTMPDVVPCAPYWLDCHALDDTNPEERERGIKNDKALIRSGVFSELWLFGDRISNGMADEIAEFEKMGLKVELMDNRLKFIKI